MLNSFYLVAELNCLAQVSSYLTFFSNKLVKSNNNRYYSFNRPNNEDEDQDEINFDFLHNNKSYVSNYINLGSISKIIESNSNTYFNKYFSDIFREKVLFIHFLGSRRDSVEELLRDLELKVTLFLMNSTDVKSFANLDVSIFNSEDLIKDNNISFKDKLLLSLYKNYNLIGYQSFDYMLFVSPHFEGSQFKDGLENMIIIITNHINKLISMYNLSEFNTIDIHSDLYLVYRIEFDTGNNSGKGKSFTFNNKGVNKHNNNNKVSMLGAGEL